MRVNVEFNCLVDGKKKVQTIETSTFLGEQLKRLFRHKEGMMIVPLTLTAIVDDVPQTITIFVSTTVEKVPGSYCAYINKKDNKKEIPFVYTNEYVENPNKKSLWSRIKGVFKNG